MDPNNAESFEAKVNQLVEATTRDANNKLVLPDGLDEATAYAVRTEIRRRDTQSSLSKVKQEADQLRAVNAELTTEWQKEAVKQLPKQERDRLDELKVTDPDKWRSELSVLEAKQGEVFSTRVAEIQANATKKTQTAINEELFKEYDERYPGLLTDQNLQEEIPAGYVKKLKDGEWTYADFLDKSVNYLQKNKVIDKGTQAPNTTDLSKVGGGGNPADADKKLADSDDYKNFVL